ncbi:Protein of unknown function [Lactobacillus acidophilus DSM 9126]|nr:Protein of unknown function [Lactobacillus acidophilus DSM 20079 = JCM 1132 = NBRC 13951 = CIP 76.13]CDF69209.1 Protein of unknown function [Lactobacillus acidophilus CIRM-BIA 442]CDF70980.1 Protein of unknown function [Lactobacillus acidophilus CIRM-BIA 445]CDF72797.1 Protein of unknown function [Lactobacillus acidophilus DSM 9126]CDF74784.1 Protein of unknown function [Lactobacillus acidophilus DSM 20242]
MNALIIGTGIQEIRLLK